MKPIYLRILRIGLTVTTVLAGLCLCGTCLWVYHNGGQQAYTPEEVAQAFAAIAVPIWLWVVLAAVTGAVHILFSKGLYGQCCNNSRIYSSRQSKDNLTGTNRVDKIAQTLHKCIVDICYL